MKKNTLIFVLFGFILSLVSSCSYFKNVQLLTGGKIKRENYVQVLPFEWRKDLIVVKARVNADTTLREFIFDTGAFNSKVENSLSNTLGLKVVTQKINSTAQGISQKIEVVRIDSLQIGVTTFYNIGAGKLRYAPTSLSHCIAANGIIGANLIKLAHWKIDYEKRLLYFSDTPFEVEEGSYVLPFDRPLLSGTPKVNIEIDGKKVENILFDVGFNGGLVLPLSVANHFEDNHPRIILDQSTSGIYGTNADSLLVKSLEVSVGGAKAQMPVEFSSLNKALLGNEFLKHFMVIINYNKKEIYLKQQHEVHVAAPRNFMASIENDSLWVVSRTTPEMPLRLGDTLLSINEKKPGDLFTSHCDYFMNIARLFEQENLRIEKMDNSIINIALQKELLNND